MSLENVKKEVESGQIPPVYLMYGEDRYSLTEAVKTVKESFLTEDPSGSGIEWFSGKDTSLYEVVEAANTCSFFSRRLVIVDDLTCFSQDKKKSSDVEKGQEAESTDVNESNGEDSLLSYCQNPNPATCLLLISEKANRGRKLYKEIARSGKVLNFSYPKGSVEWQIWIEDEAKIRGKNISPVTAFFFAEWAGHNTGILCQELDKLCSYTGENKNISIEDIEKICIPLIETTIFQMLDAIAAGKTRDVLQKLREVLSQEHYLKVYSMMVRQIRLLLAASIMRKKGEPAEKFMEITGIKSPYEGNKIYRQAANFSPKKLAGAMEECLKTELALKSSGGNPNLLLELMVIRFCR